MTTRRWSLALCALFLATACDRSQPPPVAPPAVLPLPAPTAAPIAVPAPPAVSLAEAGAPAALKDPPKAAAPTPVLRYTDGISTPESVLYDEAGDRYLVSNINGKPTEADNNGTIAELSPDGKVTNARFIAGGVNNVKLDAPKGSGIADGIFYVADIKVVRTFDVKTGAPKGDIAVAGATFLNDIAVGPGGKVYVSDTGLKPKAGGGFESTGTDAVYVIEKGKVKPLAKGKELAGPNGLLWTDKGLVVATDSNELFRLDDKGARQDVTKVPGGGLDGLVGVGATLYVTSWRASAILKGKLGDKFDVVYPELGGAADIGVDTKRKRFLVPRFMDNAVEVYEIK